MKKNLVKIIPILLIVFMFSTMTAITAYGECKQEGGKLVYCPLEPDAFKGFGEQSSGDLGKFLNQAFQFGLAIAAALAVVMIVWGGVEIMLSESVFTKSEGKKRIQDAIWGLLLALVSWLILWTINPDLLIFKI